MSSQSRLTEPSPAVALRLVGAAGGVVSACVVAQSWLDSADSLLEVSTAVTV